MPDFDAVPENVSQPGGSPAEPTPGLAPGATGTPAPTFELDGKTLTADEVRERLQTSDEAYRKVQSERDRASYQASLGKEAIDAWQYVYENRRDLYDQLMAAQTSPVPSATPPPTSAAPQGATESLRAYEERIARLEQYTQGQEERYWDAWAAGEENKAKEVYRTNTGQAPSAAWVDRLHKERMRTGTKDLVSLTRALIFEDMQAGRVTLNRAAVQATQAQVTRGMTQGAEGVAAPIDDIAGMTDEEVYLRGKAGLGLEQADTRWIGNR